MKIRSGFVSNSSSMSFLVNRDAYENVFELAKAIVVNRHRGYRKSDGEFDDDDWFENNAKISNGLIIEQLNNAVDEGVHPNTTVKIISANSDIYVGLFHDSYIVQTDRNSDYKTDLREHIIKWDLMNEFGEGDWTVEDELNMEVYDDWWKHRSIYMPEYNTLGYLLSHIVAEYQDRCLCQDNSDHRYEPVMRLRVKKTVLDEIDYPYEDFDEDDDETCIDMCPACFAQMLRDREIVLKTQSVDNILDRLTDAGDEDGE